MYNATVSTGREDAQWQLARRRRDPVVDPDGHHDDRLLGGLAGTLVSNSEIHLSTVNAAMRPSRCSRGQRISDAVYSRVPVSMSYDTGSSGCPHAQVYVAPCGHGLLICSSHSQSGLRQVRRVPGVLLALSMRLYCPPDASCKPAAKTMDGARPGSLRDRKNFWLSLWQRQQCAARECCDANTWQRSCAGMVADIDKTT